MTPPGRKGDAGLPAPREEPWEILLSFPLLVTQTGVKSELGLSMHFSLTLDNNSLLSACVDLDG